MNQNHLYVATVFDQGYPMTNDTAVFDAVRLNIRIGSEVWTGRVGTPEAIRRDGLLIGGSDIARTNGSTSVIWCGVQTPIGTISP